MRTLNMKKWLCLPLMLWAATFTSCLDDGDETVVLEENHNVEGVETYVVSTSESSVVEYSGFRLTVPQGAVPKNNSGGDGRVAFSLQQTNEMPVALPAGLEAVSGTNIKIEPMNFTFNTPLTMDVPLNGYNAHEVTLYRFSDALNIWEPVPFSKINGDGTASVALIELGQIVLVKNNGVTSSLGGVHIASRYLQRGYYYYLTLIPTNGNTNNIKRISFSANGQDLYMTNVEKGTYRVTVTRERRDALSAASGVIEYLNVGEKNVYNSLVVGSGDFSTYTGWTEVEISNYGWTSGRPDGVWGSATTTYGTGKFQATLTWVNSNGSTVDYDLHLYGPDFHVYFADERSENFELDRDWLEELGNAVENIYSISDNFTSGTYTVKVHHYDGALGKRYNCRVIVDGVMVKSVSGAINTNDQFDDIYTFTIN